MNFLTIEWFLIMALTVGVYWILPQPLRNAWLICVTATVLVIFDSRSFLILSLYAVILIYLAQPQKPSRHAFLVAGLLVLAVLIFYKIRYQGQLSDPVGNLGIPLGLSYFAFRTLHLMIELYRGTIASQTPSAVLGYLFFVPTIVVGPINRAVPYLEDRQKPELRYSMFSEGLERILYGYVKIAFIGNFLLSTRLSGFAETLGPDQESLRLYLLMVEGSLNLYFQFSGFSDVAIGFGLLLGYRIMENFRWPYFQTNIASFWRCWHISLTSWSRDNIYMPLIGVYRNPQLATITAFAFIGLWHDISLQYLLWGLYQAAGVMIWQQWQTIKRRQGLAGMTAGVPPVVFKTLSILLTVHFFMFSSLIVTQPDLFSAGRAFATILWGWL